MSNTTTTPQRRVKIAAAGVAAVALTGAGVGFGMQAAGADPGDPVTGGQTTVTVSAGSLLAAKSAGLIAYPQSPASAGYNKPANAVDYFLPVTGGDGSGRVDYGSIKHGGSIVIVNFDKKRSVTLTDITFSFETEVLSATPEGATTPIDVASLHGTQLFDYDPSTNTQELSGTDLQVDSQGAACLDKALGIKSIKAGQHIGTFDTKFQNTQG